MNCTLSANAGACLSPKDELAQEHERDKTCAMNRNRSKSFIIG